jgi:hypothetical protein
VENDKKAYQDESSQMLARQSNLIDKLKDENRNHCKEMLNNTKQKKQMIEVKKNMAEA